MRHEIFSTREDNRTARLAPRWDRESLGDRPFGDGSSPSWAGGGHTNRKGPAAEIERPLDETPDRCLV